MDQIPEYVGDFPKCEECGDRSVTVRIDLEDSSTFGVEVCGKCDKIRRYISEGEREFAEKLVAKMGQFKIEILGGKEDDGDKK